MSAAAGAEPLRRRVRARALEASVRAAGVLPHGALGALLRPLGRAALASRYAAVIDDNLVRMLPGIERRDPRVAVRLADVKCFRRDVADFAVEQATHWLRLARGAGPGSQRGAWVDELVTLDPSIEHLERALAGGRGAIVVTAHIGNWELLCARLRRAGHEGAVVGRVRHLDSSHRWLVHMRAAYGVGTIPQDAHPREALAVLEKGGVLGLLTDLHVRRAQGRAIPFFDVPARTVSAAAAFARLHGAPVVPVRCVREAGESGYRLRAEPPLDWDTEATREAATERLLAAQNAVFERWILDSPEQWAWHQRRWPTGAAPSSQP